MENYKIDWTNSDYLSFNSPFYAKEGNGYSFSYEFNDFVPKLDNLDLVSVYQHINFNYFLGDRTILKGVCKSPALSRFNTIKNKFEAPNLVLDKKLIENDEVVDMLFIKLQNEMLEYIGNAKNVGILLSGGMDSRVALGVLNSLIIENKLDKNIKIKAFTWGIDESRDVIYARRLAKKMDIQFTHFCVDEENIYDNIQYVLQNGLEYSPIHLHAMLRIAEDKDIECMIAGSYGDSIGRAEYSKRKVPFLISHKDRLNNSLSLINKRIHRASLTESERDIIKYRSRFNLLEEYQKDELEYQIHYMRRMLNPAMMSINKKIRLCQIFTSPEVYKFMLSLDPKCRSETVYEGLFKKFHVNLLDIPYARTGKIFNSQLGEVDDFSAKHHRYSHQIRKYFSDYIRKKILDKKFLDLGILNNNTLVAAVNGMSVYKKYDNIKYEDKLLWLSVLAEFISNNNISVNGCKKDHSYVGVLKYHLWKNYRK